MTQHPHEHSHEQQRPKLLRSGITIRATADRIIPELDEMMSDTGDGDAPLDFVDITVQVTSAHSARVNLNAAAIAADAALRAQLDEPAAPVSDL